MPATPPAGANGDDFDAPSPVPSTTRPSARRASRRFVPGRPHRNRSAQLPRTGTARPSLSRARNVTEALAGSEDALETKAIARELRGFRAQRRAVASATGMPFALEEQVSRVTVGAGRCTPQAATLAQCVAANPTSLSSCLLLLAIDGDDLR
jgi:hypothetical protein